MLRDVDCVRSTRFIQRLPSPGVAIIRECLSTNNVNYNIKCVEKDAQASQV
jgi:hypothetical protein